MVMSVAPREVEGMAGDTDLGTDIRASEDAARSPLSWKSWGD